MGKTTVKPISLAYRSVGSNNGYAFLMGVLKGMSLGQDDGESVDIESQFFDSPFDVFYRGEPITLDFELANYDFDDLVSLFGGTTSVDTDGKPIYDTIGNGYSSEWEWVLNFERGLSSILIYDGITVGTIKKDSDGALNYSVRISAVVWTDNQEVDHLYRIVAPVIDNPAVVGETVVWQMYDEYPYVENEVAIYDESLDQPYMDEEVAVFSNNSN